jgi:hypothetical protein
MRASTLHLGWDLKEWVNPHPVKDIGLAQL